MCIPRHCTFVLPAFKNSNFFKSAISPSIPFFSSHNICWRTWGIWSAASHSLDFSPYHFLLSSVFPTNWQLDPHLARLVFDPCCKWRDFNPHSIHSDIFIEAQIVLYLASGGLFKLASESSLHDSLVSSLLLGVSRFSRLILYISGPRYGNSYFSKELWTFFQGKWYFKTTISLLGMIIVSRLLQWTRYFMSSY